MIALGVALVAAAFGCVVAFVVAVVRADRRLRETDPTATSGLTRWPLLWLLTGSACTVGGVVVLGVELLW